MQKVVLKRAERLDGATRMASELGVTRVQLWRVRTGKCRSKRLEEALEAAGIRVMKPRKRAY